MTLRLLAPAFGTILVCALAAPAASPSPRTGTEIDSLVAALRSSGCSFERNGTWHDAATAADHLQRKREALQRRGRIATAEDFIRLGGTGSSMTGKPYLVRCPETPVTPSKTWLERRLALLRTRLP